MRSLFAPMCLLLAGVSLLSAARISFGQTATAAAPAKTAVALSATPKASPYSLSAVVTAYGKVPPTGTVTFTDTTNNNQVIGTANLGSPQPIQPGSYLPQVAYPTGTSPFGIAVGDFNADGKQDLAITNQTTNNITIYLANSSGDGTFTAIKGPATGYAPDAIVAADFNADGKLDLAVANQNSNNVTILLGNGDGTFTTKKVSPPTGNGPRALAVGDVNNDYIPDLVVANNNENTVTILLGNGDGTFKVQQTPGANAAPYAVAIGEFNGDGKPDLAIANQTANTITIMLGAGDGTFTIGSAIPTTASTPWSLTIADFDNDGHQDIAAANQGGNNVTVLLGNGDGTFTTATTSPAVGYSPYFITTFDVLGNGNAGLATANVGQNTISLLAGNGDGTFTALPPLTTGNKPYALAMGDFTGAGNHDIAVTNFGGNTVSVLLAGGTPSATASVTNITPDGPGAHTVVASYSGDTNYNGSQSSPVTILGPIVPTSLALTASPTAAVYGQTVTLAATLTPATAGTYSAGGSVTFFDGTKSICTQAISAGAASLTLTALSGGPHSFTAKYAGDANFAAGSASTPIALTVSQATAVVGGSNITLAFGTPGSATITVSGQYSNSSVAAPTGSVALQLDGISKGIYPLAAGQVTLALPATLTAGAHSITASYSGDINYLPATGTLALTISGAAGDYTITATPDALTLRAGQFGKILFTITPTGGFKDSLTFQCGTLPANTGCNFSPQQVVALGDNAVLTTTLTVITSGPNQNSAELSPLSFSPGSTISFAALASGLSLFFRRRRFSQHLRSAVLVLALAVACFGVSACSLMGTSSTTTTSNSSKNTPAGVTEATITASAGIGSDNQSAAFTLTVLP